jgi:hypothetical protein
MMMVVWPMAPGFLPPGVFRLVAPSFLIANDCDAGASTAKPVFESVWPFSDDISPPLSDKSELVNRQLVKLFEVFQWKDRKRRLRINIGRKIR